MRDSATAIANEWSQKLAELPVKLIEKPAFRLAGAEEAVRQAVQSIQQVLERHEPLGRSAAELRLRVIAVARPSPADAPAHRPIRQRGRACIDAHASAAKATL